MVQNINVPFIYKISILDETLMILSQVNRIILVSGSLINQKSSSLVDKFDLEYLLTASYTSSVIKIFTNITDIDCYQICWSLNKYNFHVQCLFICFVIEKIIDPWNEIIRTNGTKSSFTFRFWLQSPWHVNVFKPVSRIWKMFKKQENSFHIHFLFLRT